MTVTLSGVYMLMGRQSKYSKLDGEDPGKSPAYIGGTVEDGSMDVDVGPGGQGGTTDTNPLHGVPPEEDTSTRFQVDPDDAPPGAMQLQE